jgi:hypothetical protein
LSEFINRLAELKIPVARNPATSSRGRSPSLAEILVTDAGPLIAFGRLDKLSLLGAIFEGVIVPQAVYDETQSRPDLPDAVAIHAAAQAGSVKLVPSATPHAGRARDLPRRRMSNLIRGAAR